MQDINWIECNLPWKSLQEIPKKILDYPQEQLDALSEKKFGITYDSVVFERKKLGRQVKKRFLELQDNNPDLSLYELKKITDDINVMDYIKLSIMEDEITEFEYNSDIYKQYQYQLENQKSFDEFETKRSKISFYPDLAKPGILMELESGKQILIGHINPAGGVCDDCRLIEANEIVKRYAVIMEF